MKCLLCYFETNEIDSLKKHYLEYHNVDSKNRFFKKVIDTTGKKENNVFHGKKCARCNEFLPTVVSRLNHDFLKHYDAGRVALTEEKPMTIFDVGPIKIFEIRCYDFSNSEQVVDEFLFNVKSKVARSEVDFFIRCGFSIQNIQPSPESFDQPLLSSRYWSTDPIQTKSFNDFVFVSVRDSVLKRVINNGLTSSSWRFNRFNYINVKTTTTPIVNVVR